MKYRNRIFISFMFHPLLTNTNETEHESVTSSEGGIYEHAILIDRSTANHLPVSKSWKRERLAMVDATSFQPDCIINGNEYK